MMDALLNDSVPMYSHSRCRLSSVVGGKSGGGWRHEDFALSCFREWWCRGSPMDCTNRYNVKTKRTSFDVVLRMNVFESAVSVVARSVVGSDFSILTVMRAEKR